MFLAKTLLYPVPVRHRKKIKIERHILLVPGCFNLYVAFQLKMLNTSIGLVCVCAHVVLTLQHVKSQCAVVTYLILCISRSTSEYLITTPTFLPKLDSQLLRTTQMKSWCRLFLLAVRAHALQQREEQLKRN